jgi:hypothetical protein
MERDKLAKSYLSAYCLSFISKARVVLLPEGGTKRVTSPLLMLIFIISALVVLAVSIVLMAAESVISALLLPTKAPKKATLQDLLRGERLSRRQLTQTNRVGEQN